MRYRKLTAAILGTLALCACSNVSDIYNEELANQRKKAEYQANFIKSFGEIDTEHTWNSTSQYKVTSSSEDDKTIEIFSYHPCNAYARLYGYGNAGETFTFDAPQSLENVYVAVSDENGKYEYYNVGVSDGRITFNTDDASTRSYFTDKEGNEITDANDYEYVVFTPDDISQAKALLPENGDASLLINNYEFYYDGPTRIYPCYGSTSASDEVGYYYHDTDDNIVYVPLIGNVKTFWKDNIGYAELYNTETENWEQLDNVVVYNGVTNWTTLGYSMKSKGLLIDGVEMNTRVGLYVKQYGYTFHSNSELNSYTNASGGKYFSAVKEFDNSYLIGLEDWIQGDADCNDIMLYIFPTPSLIPVEVLENKCTMAFEDMGTVGDYDFNDVVIEVSEIKDDDSGIRIDLMAAGGLMNFKLYFNNELLIDKEADGIPSYANTNPYVTNSIIKTVYASKPNGFTMSSSYYTSLFKLYVYSGEDDGNGTENITYITTNTEAGIAPQVIVIPEEWEFPYETQSIAEKYPKFLDYVSDKTVVWYK